ncbi:MAG: hypothetical protein H6684_03840 [Deltaproteobacteria bacterium]|nr:hypothetical protein [Deltaproteobacteria bacterium]
MFVVSPASAAWQAKATLPEARWGGAYVSDGDYLYYIGGGVDGDATSDLKDTVYRYDPALDTWDTMAPMPLALGQIDAGRIGDKIYVPGGTDDPDVAGVVKTLYIYDITDDAWTTGASLPVANGLEGYAVTVIDGILYVLGGYDYEVGSWSRKAYAYDPTKDSWETFPNDMTHGGWELAAWSFGDDLYAAGGNNGSLVVDTATAETYDFETEAWDDGAMDDLPATAAAGADAEYGTALDGFLLFLGGYGNLGQAKTAWSYDIDEDKWSADADLPQEFVYAEADCLDGVIYIAGGSDKSESAPHKLHYALDTGGLCVGSAVPTTTTTSTTTTTTIPGTDDDDDDDDAADDDDDDSSDDDDVSDDDDDDDDSGCGC